MALPTQLRAGGVPLADVTALAALLVLPWTLKFAWAPLVDVAARRGFGLPAVIVTAQAAMGATLVSLLVLDWQADFAALRAFLLAHAVAAATQDVAIDAWCIRVTVSAERARMNGWMQVGVLLGRALLGGGALVLVGWLGMSVVVGVLIVVTTFSGLLVLAARSGRGEPEPEMAPLVPALRDMVRRRITWVGLVFALVAGASYRALEVVVGPFLVDRGYGTSEVGWLAAGPLIGATMLGALAGGMLGDRMPRRRVVAGALGFVVASVGAVAVADVLGGEGRGLHLPILLTVAALASGVFTAASYALFMDVAAGRVAATQFSAFMGATNGCEAWAVYCVGRMEPALGYPGALLVLCGVSLVALPLVRALGARGSSRTGS